MPRLASLALCALALTVLAGCGTSYTPARNTNFEMDREAEIDDEDIRKAFEARPQMPAGAIRLAYYTLDPEVAGDLERVFGRLPGVTSVYRIPSLLVTGQRRLSEGHGNGYPYGPPQDISLKKLRLLAARANTDVLVIVDHGYRNMGANPLVATTALLLPVLFVPFVDTEVKGYVEAFVLDVRNGYLYGHVSEEDTRGEPYATIYAKSAKDYADEQWIDLRQSLQKQLAKVIEDERARKPVPSAPPPPPPPDPAVPLAAPPAAPPGTAPGP
ncbi:hypothetical protein [Polyangium mundeleinium]|uniref:Lipoprotein n=1 Tax=Polyangium mundeleinium TaxID=2995306 RepID=A0ABT5EFI3_9BACT|nr:hypothetical protein [Polyangium mundeleinium]MDC0740229.1 hypothetical protein [Polyangium mundeleinium]